MSWTKHTAPTNARLWLVPHCPRNVGQRPHGHVTTSLYQPYMQTCGETRAHRHAARHIGTDQSRCNAMTSRSIISLQRHVMCLADTQADIALYTSRPFTILHRIQPTGTLIAVTCFTDSHETFLLVSNITKNAVGRSLGLAGGVARWLDRRRTFPTVDRWPLRGKPSAVCQLTWATQPFILLGSINE